MKNIAVYISNHGRNSNDQWVTCRGEGRNLINIGFGLGLLGHEVDIICGAFSNKDNVIPGVNLRHEVDALKNYDAAFTYNADPNFSNYKKLFYYLEISNPKENLLAIVSRFPNATFMFPSRRQINLALSGDSWWAENFKIGDNLKFLGCLYPIPCLPGLETQDFKKLDFDTNKTNIKVWAYINGWPNYYLTCDNAILWALRRLRDAHAFDIDLTIHLAETKFYNMDLARIISEFKPKILKNDDFNYLGMIDMISSMDLCITKGGPYFCGMCSYDIISLGKPMLYCVTGKNHNDNNNINELIPLTDYIIQEELGKYNAEDVVDRFIADPNLFFDKMKEAYKEHSFPFWKDIATELLSA